MANWISIKAASEMFGITEEQICILMKLRYINFSYVDDSKLMPDENSIIMVDTESINRALDLNIVSSLEEIPDCNSIVRIPLVELKELLRISEEYHKLKATLQTKPYSFIFQANERKEISKESEVTPPKVNVPPSNNIKQIKNFITGKAKGIWSFLNKLF